MRAGLGATGVLLVDSGTTALQTAMALTATPGQPPAVAIPAYCCYNIATAVVGSGARAWLYDLDPRTLAPDPDSLRACLERGARAVVLSHLYGVPVDPRGIQEVAASHGAALIVDSAQGMGASLAGRPAAAYGDLSILSFGRGKGLAAGSGGAVAAFTDSWSRRLDSTRASLAPGGAGVLTWAKVIAQWILGRPWLYGLPQRVPFLGLGETHYLEPWGTRQMEGIPALAVRPGWVRVASDVAIQRANAKVLVAHASTRLPAVVPPAESEPSYLRFPTVAEPALADLVGKGTWRALGIAPGYPIALCDLPQLRANLGDAGASTFPGARMLARCLVTLPTHRLLTSGDLERLCVWMDDAADGRLD